MQKPNRLNFRAYDAELGVFHTLRLFSTDHGCDSDVDLDYTEMPVTQSTGLVDVKGVEIYEHDIVKALSSNDKSLPCLVTWHDRDARFAFRYKHNTTFIDLSRGCSGWEVIGNVYQSPELLGWDWRLE